MLSEHSTSASLADPLTQRAPDTRAPQNPAALLSIFCGKLRTPDQRSAAKSVDREEPILISSRWKAPTDRPSVSD
jgi:hypothetical protein